MSLLRLPHRWHVSIAAALLVPLIACNDDGPTDLAADAAFVTVRPREATLVEGDTLRLAAAVLDADHNLLSGRPVGWSSSDLNIASVDEGGLVGAVAQGSAVITATSNDVSGSGTVTVRRIGTSLDFVGYTDPTAKVTACASCHQEDQVDWPSTAHANAWATLQASGQTQDFCESCHTVTERGNAVEGPAGHDLQEDARFYDVQCEACHGPGMRHVSNPDAEQPQASISVGADLRTGCGECHRGADQPYAEQWEASRLGRGPHLGQAVNAGDPSCLSCHDGKTALIDQFGESASYLEKLDQAVTTVVCVVCHDPHGSDFEDDLRAPISEPSPDFLCLRCHASRGTPPSQNGPHAAQGLLLMGENVGWLPPGSENFLSEIMKTASHGPSKNERLCVTCHMPIFDVTDPATGGRIYRSVGHTFRAISCLDSQGIPVAGPCELSARYFDGCSISGCHGGPEWARDADYKGIISRLNELLDSLWHDTDNDSVIDATDGGLLPRVVARGDPFQLDVTDDSVTVPEGALWNAQLAFTSERPYFGDGEVFGIRFSASKTSGNGVHNPILLEPLLGASIRALRDYLESQ